MLPAIAYRCPCCLKELRDEEWLTALESILDGTCYRITSGYRCVKHNQDVGGAPASVHLLGHAADIAVSSPADRYRVVMRAIAAGVPRIRIYPSHVHIDVDHDLPDGLWLADYK